MRVKAVIGLVRPVFNVLAFFVAKIGFLVGILLQMAGKEFFVTGEKNSGRRTD